MKLFNKKLTGFIDENPNLRWKGFYKVCYKGKWVVARFDKFYADSDKRGWHWQLADGKILYNDDDFDKIIEKPIK